MMMIKKPLINIIIINVVGTAYPIHSLFISTILGLEAKCICTPDLTSLAVQGNSTTVVNGVCTITLVNDGWSSNNINTRGGKKVYRFG